MPGDADELEGWIRSAREGDTAAVDELCRHFEKRVAAYVTRHMGQRARRWTDPDDIVQRALYETMRGLDRLPEDADEDELLKRLFKTADSRIKDDLRKHERTAGESILPEGHGGFAPGIEETLTGTVTRADERAFLVALIDRLPEGYRDIVKLCALEGKTFVEAGHELDMSHEKVRWRYNQACEKLSKKLEQRRGG